LLERDIPSPWRESDGVQLFLERPDFGDYLQLAFGDIRRAARAELRVSLHLLDILRGLSVTARDEPRAGQLRLVMREIVEGFDTSHLTAAERQRLARAS
jgi:uncharacterized membrane protein